MFCVQLSSKARAFISTQMQRHVVNPSPRRLTLLVWHKFNGINFLCLLQLQRCKKNNLTQIKPSELCGLHLFTINLRKLVKP
ncbi:CLUMA_CG010407, isoform A [Clunio marinus]|uniref:CLUMA_CG010407, isoform A n=1 Tax=Clunio marinus TaxID=568069 RepID=A0A1J1I9J3_9DIPT|nr:CLUMA_CG010407, isoform A [Clunio marinus]